MKTISTKMHPPLVRSTLSALAAAGLAFAPAVLAQQPAPSDQAVKNETVHSNAPDRHLAPRDTFYTMDYASARTDKGVEGFPPGTEVHLVAVNREAHTLTVTDGHANVELPPDKLTNDIDIGAMVRANDTANQENIARYQQAELASYQKYQQEVAQYTAKDLEKREQAIQKSNEQLQEQAATSHTSDQPSTLASSFSNGYYTQGGNGFGSPYSYFVDLGGYNQQTVNGGRTPQTSSISTTGSNGKGAISSAQNGTQSGNSRTGGATSGTTSSSTGGGTGKGSGKP